MVGLARQETAISAEINLFSYSFEIYLVCLKINFNGFALIISYLVAFILDEELNLLFGSKIILLGFFSFKLLLFISFLIA